MTIVINARRMREGYCNHPMCLSVCMSVCLCVCLSVTALALTYDVQSALNPLFYPTVECTRL